MNILVFNPGSNSLKFQLIRSFPDRWGETLFQGNMEPIGAAAVFQASLPDQQPLLREEIALPDLGAGARSLLAKIQSGAFQAAGVHSLSDINLIACRVVHGGCRFRDPIRADTTVLAAIEALDDLAPLHNAQSVSILKVTLETFQENSPVIAIFDSAFHATLPEVAWRYAIDYDLAEKHSIRRYGFHGISHQYLMLRYAEIQGIAPREVTAITLHLEGGSSATAIRDGLSIDTSMGFTPLEGLMMATRSGDLDPAIVEFLARKQAVGVSAVIECLNRRSGLFGVSGSSPDTRVLVAQTGRSQLALDMFAYRVRKYIGAYMAAIGRSAAIVFGGGIGENTPEVRRRICEGLGHFGLLLDNTRNAETIDREACITKPSSPLQAWVIPTREALMMARLAAGWQAHSS